MARRKPISPSAADRAADEREDLERRYRWLPRFLIAAEPGSLAVAHAERIRAKKARLDARGGPIDRRVAELEDFLAALGLFDQADRFADRFATTPQRQPIRKGANG